MPLSIGSSSLQKPSRLFFFGLLLAVSAPVFLLGLGSYGMLDPTDSFFVEGPKEMLERAHFLTPLFNYVDWFDKPALPFLLIISSYKIFGVSAWAARLPSALSGIALVLVTAAVTRRILGTRTAWLCGLVLAACPLFVIVGRCALTDEPLALLIGASLLLFAQSLIQGERTAAIGAYVALALAIVCKGPIGFVIVLGSLITFAGLEWWHSSGQLARLNLYPGLLRPWTGALLLLIVACPYFVFAHVTTNGDFTNEFFFHQNLGRMEGTVNHQQPFWWYIPVFLGGYLPWTVFLVVGAGYFKRIWQKRVWTRRQRLAMYSFAWLAFVFVLFTLVPTKLPTYIVPLSPALAILVGIYLDFLVRVGKSKVFFVFALSELAVAFVPLALLPWLMPAVPLALPTMVIAAIVLGIFAVLQLKRIQLGKLREAMTGQILSVLFALIIMIPTGFRYYYATHQKSIDRLVGLAKEKNANLATLFNSVPSAIFAYDHRIEMLQSLEEVEKFAKTGPSPHWLLATQNCLQMPDLAATKRLIAHEGKWYLLSVDNFTLPEKKQ
jgi:4-amino-4-deoxy-L-arabinose transferase-like glycosyltransferase